MYMRWLLIFLVGCTASSKNLDLNKYYHHQYHIDLNKEAKIGLHYLSIGKKDIALHPKAVIFDIDDTLLSSYEYMTKLHFDYDLESWRTWVAKSRGTLIKPMKRVYDRAKKDGYRVFLITGRTEDQRQVTIKNLKQVGIIDYDGLFMMERGKKDIASFKKNMRNAIEHMGYQIWLNVSDQSGDMGSKSHYRLKVANPFYHIGR